VLVIPLRDGAALHSLQFIDAEGGKRFLTGGRVAGCYFSIGNPTSATALCIAEGFATSATIHEATGCQVAVAFNAGNLEPVARALRAKFPDVALILCAEDNVHTNGNPGLTKATVGNPGLLSLPTWATPIRTRTLKFARCLVPLANWPLSMVRLLLRCLISMSRGSKTVCCGLWEALPLSLRQGRLTRW
jgi:hypothetical protein